MKYLLYILVALMPFVIADNLWDYSNLPKALFIQNGVILLAVFFFWTRKFKIKGIDGLNFTVSKTLIAYILFLAWAGLSIFWATNKYEAVVIFTHWSVCGLFLFCIQNMNIDKRVVFLILVFTAWIVVLIGLGQHFFRLDWVLQSSPPASTFANKNLTNGYILMTMPLCVAFMVSTYQCKKWVSFVKLSLIMATTLTYIGIANRKTAVAVIPIIGTYYLVKYLRRLDYSMIAILTVGLFVAGYLYLNPAFFQEGSLSHRVQIWQHTGEIIKSHPIVGVGAGNFKVYYDKYADLRMNTDEAHNDYVQMLCELGIVGIYLAFLVIVYAFRGAFKKRDSYSTALKAGLWAFLIVAMFNFPMQKAAEPFICALYLGMLKV